MPLAMTTDKHEITSPEEAQTKDREKTESISEEKYVGESGRIDGFSGNLENGELEPVENYDTTHAIMEGLPPAPLTKDTNEYKEYQPDFIKKEVCGRDDRTRVTNTTPTPFRQICHLIMQFPNTTDRFVGTGWLIGPKTVMTAGHCVYDRRYGGWATRIEVIPGRNGNIRPYGSRIATVFRSNVGWTGDNNPEFDYGAIILPDNTLGNTVGYFGFASLTDAELQSLLVNNSGYPLDRQPFGTQWYNAGKITRINGNKIFYLLDSFGGQSGSVIWRYQNNQRTAIAIHAYGGCPNSATRINNRVFSNMITWRNE